MTMAIAELQRQLAKMVTLGVVAEINATNGTAVVDLGDGLETPHIPTVQTLAGANGTTYAMPAVGEQVVVLAIGGKLETAFIMGSVYQSKHPAIATDGKTQSLKAADGATFTYDGKGNLSISGVSAISVTATNMTLGGNVNITGALSIGDNMTIGKTLSVKGTSTFSGLASFSGGTAGDRT